MKQRRTNATIFYDILNAINIETLSSSPSSPKREGFDLRIGLTAVQLMSKVSFDKLKHHLTRMFQRGLITDPTNPRVTPHGKNFMNDFGKLQKDAHDLALIYNFPIEAPDFNNDSIVTVDNIQFVKNLATNLEITASKFNALVEMRRELQEQQQQQPQPQIIQR